MYLGRNDRARRLERIRSERESQRERGRGRENERENQRERERENERKSESERERARERERERERESESERQFKRVLFGQTYLLKNSSTSSPPDSAKLKTLSRSNKISSCQQKICLEFKVNLDICCT
jgi:hypothetical protein